jgi:hypothetical protein
MRNSHTIPPAPYPLSAGLTPLTMAAFSNSVQRMKVLLKYGEQYKGEGGRGDLAGGVVCVGLLEQPIVKCPRGECVPACLPACVWRVACVRSESSSTQERFGLAISAAAAAVAAGRPFEVVVVVCGRVAGALHLRSAQVSLLLRSGCPALFTRPMYTFAVLCVLCAVCAALAPCNINSTRTAFM